VIPPDNLASEASAVLEVLHEWGRQIDAQLSRVAAAN